MKIHISICQKYMPPRFLRFGIGTGGVWVGGIFSFPPAACLSVSVESAFSSDVLSFAMRCSLYSSSVSDSEHHDRELDKELVDAVFDDSLPLRRCLVFPSSIWKPTILTDGFISLRANDANGRCSADASSVCSEFSVIILQSAELAIFSSTVACLLKRSNKFRSRTYLLSRVRALARAMKSG